jgi:hypothetical protein
MTTLVLGRDGMGPNSDEAAFKAWVAYVEDRIDERAGFVVDVEWRGKRDVQSDMVYDCDSEGEKATVEEVKRDLWNEWCAEGAPGGT